MSFSTSSAVSGTLTEVKNALPPPPPPSACALQLLERSAGSALHTPSGFQRHDGGGVTASYEVLIAMHPLEHETPLQEIAADPSAADVHLKGTGCFGSPGLPSSITTR